MEAVEWSGGKRPVSNDQWCRVKYRIGGWSRIIYKPQALRWKHTGSNGDIVEYKLEKTK